MAAAKLLEAVRVKFIEAESAEDHITMAVIQAAVDAKMDLPGLLAEARVSCLAELTRLRTS